jgi:hypothetical protein
MPLNYYLGGKVKVTYLAGSKEPLYVTVCFVSEISPCMQTDTIPLNIGTDDYSYMIAEPSEDTAWSLRTTVRVRACIGTQQTILTFYGLTPQQQTTNPHGLVCEVKDFERPKSL